ncbi:hypothetical protein VTJ04DRAFT_5918 [Mycothermus thermophilus]|uniref:uncharacterized protein n=1 Tax=Humicola insolens TaxID=85995 RepID=UPI003743C117
MCTHQLRTGRASRLLIHHLRDKEALYLGFWFNIPGILGTLGGMYVDGIGLAFSSFSSSFSPAVGCVFDQCAEMDMG